MSRRNDRRRMGRALMLAAAQLGRTGDNPSVGCVIVSADGLVIGEGATADGGRPHAEETALRLAGVRAKGGSAYVTLEPCRERSNGDPSCADLLIEAGVARVVCATADRHPQGAGGLERLRSAGVRVDFGLKAASAAPLYRTFFKGLGGGG